MLRNFSLILFSIKQLHHAIFGLRGVFLASSGLHDLWGQKKSCPCLSLLKFEKLQWNKFFNRTYGLTANRSISPSGHPLIINKIHVRDNKNTGYFHFSNDFAYKKCFYRNWFWFENQHMTATIYCYWLEPFCILLLHNRCIYIMKIDNVILMAGNGNAQYKQMES